MINLLSKGRPDEFNYERNDCTVRAYSNAAHISYQDAHNELASLGRKVGKGFRFSILAELKGWKVVPRPHMTAETFVRSIALYGNWIVRIKGHVFAVVNGEIQDIYPAASLKCHVLQAWLVE